MVHGSGLVDMVPFTEAVVIYADSVKKKKMNKHKYRKTQDLREIGLSEYHPYFVKRLVSIAMDRNHKEKEKASGLYAVVVSPDQIRVGFIRFIESVGDLALHIPDLLALFIARAIVDEILPPVFLARAKKTLPESSEGFQVILTVEKSYLWAPQMAKGFSHTHQTLHVLAPLNLEEISSSLPPKSTGSETARHAGKRLLRSWGGGTGWAVEDAKDKIWKLLEEYETRGVVSSVHK
ncbi:unnamed protein product [Brassica napus]|uniref:(rape) hypothetical protein n=1 Tax=Brassica napus TaxID=3708 RepID=A0A816SEX1_BRANA|nr:unnamed protein product [Brassica napus]